MPITEQQIQKVMGSRAYAYEQKENVTFMIVDAGPTTRICNKVSGKIENVRIRGNVVSALTFSEHYFMSSSRPAYIPLSECLRMIEGDNGTVAVIVQKGSYSVYEI